MDAGSERVREEVGYRDDPVSKIEHYRFVLIVSASWRSMLPTRRFPTSMSRKGYTIFFTNLKLSVGLSVCHKLFERARSKYHHFFHSCATILEVKLKNAVPGRLVRLLNQPPTMERRWRNLFLTFFR